MEQLLDDLSACGEPQALFELVGTRLDELIRPESCVLYSRTGRAFAPVFQRASAVPPAFAIDGDLIPMLGARRVALELGRQSRLPPDSVDRAALEALGAALLLPIHQHGELVAFVCLGHKRSGDVYIATDLALLGTVAQRVTVELQGFDAVHVRRQSEEMQSALRRYVPGAVAEHIEQGRELGAAECDITVLFVDIRGYTTYSEARSATEIFEMVNRYTEAVSTVVRRHGGTVVEFSGDGLMVVFGAPTAIPHKERAAVAAAREAVTTVRALALGAGKTADRGLDVGIGIASGSAFVGNIRAVDRMIWGAIGNTTNLAARLQNLSRDLGASIVIDAATRDADPGAAEDFQRHPQITIRGRQRREDVYALAL
jgi:class 3 adenylate cyclase